MYQWVFIVSRQYIVIHESIWSVGYPPWSKENNTILKKVYYYYHYYNYHQHYHCCYYSLFAVPGKFKILKITIIMNRIWYEKSVLYHSHIRFLIIWFCILQQYFRQRKFSNKHSSNDNEHNLTRRLTLSRREESSRSK